MHHSSTFPARRAILTLTAALAAAAVLAAPASAGNGGRRCTKRNPCPAADTSAPTVSVAAPTASATVSGTITVSGTSSDNVGISLVEVAIDGGAWAAASGTTSWSRGVDTSALGDGTHLVSARATDPSGNWTVTAVTVNVSNTPAPPPADVTAPTIQVSSPSAGATVAGTAPFTGTASDAVGVTAVEVSVDGGPWQPAGGTTSWSMAIDTTGLANGSHTFAARAWDAAGNTGSASVPVTVSNTTAPPPSWSPPPATQGIWVSPEGVTIEVNTAGSWTIDVIYQMLVESARDLDVIGPHLSIKVQDSYASQTASGASRTNGVYTSFSATIYLKGVSSAFASLPDSQLAHEFGHAWTMYHLYLVQQGSWTAYLNTRWSSADGAMTIGQDSRLSTSYSWDVGEMIAEDYRLLFGSPAAISECPTHLNSEIVDPRNQPGLADWFLTTWRG